jgi:hypothetical protein
VASGEITEMDLAEQGVVFEQPAVALQGLDADPAGFDPGQCAVYCSTVCPRPWSGD